jgi:hypothetical protein
MHRPEYLSLIAKLEQEGGTIKDLKKREPNYSQEQVAEALENAITNRLRKAVKRIDNGTATKIT